MADDDTPAKDGEPPGDTAAEKADPAQSLPPVESLDKDSDFTPFLAEGVPEDLARAALGKLWRSDPAFASLDGLDDYDEDYSIIQEVVSVVAKALTGKEDETESAPVEDEDKIKETDGKEDKEEEIEDKEEEEKENRENDGDRSEPDTA